MRACHKSVNTHRSDERSAGTLSVAPPVCISCPRFADGQTGLPIERIRPHHADLVTSSTDVVRVRDGRSRSEWDCFRDSTTEAPSTWSASTETSGPCWGPTPCHRHPKNAENGVGLPPIPRAVPSPGAPSARPARGSSPKGERYRERCTCCDRRWPAAHFADWLPTPRPSSFGAVGAFFSTCLRS